MALNIPAILKGVAITLIVLVGVICGVAFLFIATLRLTVDQIIFLAALAAMAVVAWVGYRS